MENLRALGASTIITDLMSTPRSQTGIEMAHQISDIFLTKPVNEWESELPSFDAPGAGFNNAQIYTTVVKFLIFGKLVIV